MRPANSFSKPGWLAIAGFLLIGCAAATAQTTPPDLIPYNGKIVTVDRAFSIAQATAVRDGRIVRVGTSADLLADKGPSTTLVDLKGRTVIPGLIDSHVHPAAAMTEFDHLLPEMESVEDILDYV